MPAAADRRIERKTKSGAGDLWLFPATTRRSPGQFVFPISMANASGLPGAGKVVVGCFALLLSLCRRRLSGGCGS